MSAIIFWIITGLVAIGIDILTSSFCFVLLGVGSIVAAVCSGIGLTFNIQIIAYAIANIISVSIGYPYLRKKYKQMCKRTPRMEETYIGKILESDKEIKNKGQIKVGGEYWTAINEGDLIEQGDKFKITGIQGIKLTIKKI